MSLRARVRRWVNHPPARYELDQVPQPERLGALCGYRSGDVMVIVSPSGMHLPLAAPSAVRVVEVATYLGWVGGLPEVVPGSRT